MPIRGLPERPDLDHFRRQARSLQRAARAGDPAAVARLARHYSGRAPADAGGRKLATAQPAAAQPAAAQPAAAQPAAAQPAAKLAAAQLVVAREYGFASWPRLVHYLKTVAEHGWDTGLGAAPAAGPADEFCRLACLTYGRQDGPERWARARRLLAEHSELTRTHIWAAAAAARPDDVERLLAEKPRRAVERGGPFRWRPLFYLAYSRFDRTVPAERVVAVARRLLDAGADPNEGYLFDGLPTPFTVLTGVFGHGELGQRRQPRHPRWRALGRLLLDAGADPNDGQTLYNRMFGSDDSHLEMLFAYGLGSGDGPWRSRIPDLETPARLLRAQLRWAVEHHQPGRVRLLVEHGVDFRAPFEDRSPARTPVELAQLTGDTEIADYLLSRGAPPPGPDPVRELIAAAFRADRSAVARICREHPDAAANARSGRPGLMVWAATQAPVDTATILAELGFDVNAYGRGDAPIEEPWETALHHSAGTGNVALTRRLLDLGADPGLRDKRFDATPLGWAEHLGQEATAALLGPAGMSTMEGP